MKPPIKIPKICLSNGTKNKVVKKMAIKIGSPPALGVILVWIWAGCGLKFGSSSKLNLWASFMTKGVESRVIKNAIEKGKNRFNILDKNKNYF